MKRALLLSSSLSLAACSATVIGGGSTGDASSGSSTTSAATSGGSSGSGQGGATGICVPCGGECVDFANDPHHCGGCAGTCAGNQICDHGACVAPTCHGPSCPKDQVCCGDTCCQPWEMCCNVPGGASKCMDLEAGLCPTTCTEPGACPGCTTCN